MATTTGGSTYVVSTDLVANYPTASLAIANRVDVVASGSMSKKTASYTVTVADILAGTTICMNSASATVITLPSSSLVNGMIVKVFSVNTGAVTFTGGTVTGSTTSITAQYSGLTLTYDSGAAVWWSLPFAGGSAKATVTSATGTYTTGANGSKTFYRWTGSGTVVIGVGGLCDVLVAGGGGGGGGTIGGGGGAGGLLDSTLFGTQMYLAAGTYTVTIGGGGAAGSNDRGTQGTASTLGIFTAAGGGAGGGGGGLQQGFYGGSGGGAGGANTSSIATGSVGITPQGRTGGGSTSNVAGGGGGGYGSNGTTGGAGGSGGASSITGSSVTYSAGGNYTGFAAGTANTGNGGGGNAAGSSSGGAGGSGVVVLLIG